MTDIVFTDTDNSGFSTEVEVDGIPVALCEALVDGKIAVEWETYNEDTEDYETQIEQFESDDEARTFVIRNIDAIVAMEQV